MRRWERRELPWVLVFLVLPATLGSLIGTAIHFPDGDHVYAGTFFGLSVGAVGAAIMLRDEANRRKGRTQQAYDLYVQRLKTPPEEKQAALAAEYHRDCVAVAEDTMTYEELFAKWSGKVPKRRPSQPPLRDYCEEFEQVLKDVGLE